MPESTEHEERPSKIRKVSHGDQGSASALLSLLNEQHDPSSSTDAPKQPKLKQHDNADPEPSPERKAQLRDVHSEGSRPSQAELTTFTTQSPSQPLSKNQIKKQRKKAEWEAGRASRKARKKEKDKQKKELKREQRQQEIELRKANGEPPLPPPTRPKHHRPIRLPVTFMIDCAFDDKMLEKELISLGSQVTRAYGDNSKAPYQGHLVISSWGGLLKERFDTTLGGDYKNWRSITFVEDDFVAAAEQALRTMRGPQGGKMEGMFKEYKSHNNRNGTNIRRAAHEASTVEEMTVDPITSASSDEQVQPEIEVEIPAEQSTNATTNISTAEPTLPDPSSSSPLPPPETIYLTSDSPNTLTHLHPYSTYIVGGIVDKNRHKGLCYQRACERGVQTAKLPIGEFMEMQSRYVLATSHVVEIMVRWLECGDWGEAFLSVIPQRKGARLKRKDKQSGMGEGEGLRDGEREENVEDERDGDGDDQREDEGRHDQDQACGSDEEVEIEVVEPSDDDAEP